ncbi:MAG: GNAT family N-acetyltransferase [Clostridia bacterium]|nr:GNAT family N-acetyltransferase [Clostridia bacterium]
MIEIKTLKTNRLTLKKLSLKNLDDFFEWHKQEQYYVYLPTKPKTKAECKKYLKNKIKGYKNKTNQVLLWGIFFNDKLVGSVNISTLSFAHRCCEIGWGISPTFHRQGIAYEAISEFIKYIFNDLNMNKIKIVYWKPNVASGGLAKKLGFANEGVERQARYKNNEYIDVICCGLLKSEWEGKRGKDNG